MSSEPSRPQDSPEVPVLFTYSVQPPPDWAVLDFAHLHDVAASDVLAALAPGIAPAAQGHLLAQLGSLLTDARDNDTDLLCLARLVNDTGEFVASLALSWTSGTQTVLQEVLAEEGGTLEDIHDRRGVINEGTSTGDPDWPAHLPFQEVLWARLILPFSEHGVCAVITATISDPDEAPLMRALVRRMGHTLQVSAAPHAEDQLKSAHPDHSTGIVRSTPDSTHDGDSPATGASSAPGSEGPPQRQRKKVRRTTKGSNGRQPTTREDAS